jgi:hypothetical protein
VCVCIRIHMMDPKEGRKEKTKGGWMDRRKEHLLTHGHPRASRFKIFPSCPPPPPFSPLLSPPFPPLFLSYHFLSVPSFLHLSTFVPFVLFVPFVPFLPFLPFVPFVPFLPFLHLSTSLPRNKWKLTFVRKTYAAFLKPIPRSSFLPSSLPSSLPSFLSSSLPACLPLCPFRYSSSVIFIPL